MTDNPRADMLPLIRSSSLLAAPPRKRLWLATGGVALFVVTVLIANGFALTPHPLNSRMLGHDFLAFYTGGALVRAGHWWELYDLSAVWRFEQGVAGREHLDLGNALGPFWNPPFYAWVFAPLAHLNFLTALCVWSAVGLAALAGAVVLLCRMLPERDWRTWGLVVALIVISAPFLQAFTHGQNTFTSLLLLAVVVTAWRARRGFLAGAALGLLLYKPQLAAVIAVALVVDLGWSAAIGLGAVAFALMGVTQFVMPGSMSFYLHRLPVIVHYMQTDNPYIWERHVTLKSFWRLLLQGRGAGEDWARVSLFTALCAFPLAPAVLAAAIRTRQLTSDALGRDRLITATILAMPLLMPFYFDYDLLLLAIPVVLFAAERMRRGAVERRRAADRCLLAVLVGLYLWLLVNPDVAELTRVNGSVLLLAAAAGLSIARVFRTGAPVTIEPGADLAIQPGAMARAV